jgi:hypothetical protein
LGALALEKRQHLLSVIEHGSPEGRGVGSSAEEVTHDRKQQVRLPLLGRDRLEECE